MRKYCQLTEEDHIEIYAIKQAEISQAQIADKLVRYRRIRPSGESYNAISAYEAIEPNRLTKKPYNVGTTHTRQSR